MIRAVVSDIEGTTSSIAFVHEVLFPYAREHLPAYVRDHRDDQAVAPLLQDVAREAGRALSTREVIEQLVQWIDEDRKVTPLKALQGLVWEHGYRNGDFFGHVYQDTVDAFRKWHAQGVRLYLYSSGSVQAQKLLFAHTRYGDLTPLFSGYFDTRIGAKGDTQSYAAIQAQLAVDACDILFCSDVAAELDAAAGTGIKTCWFLRETATIPGDGHHPAVQSFADVDLSAF
jgi:enolase-phosphatase E1